MKVTVKAKKSVPFLKAFTLTFYLPPLNVRKVWGGDFFLYLSYYPHTSSLHTLHHCSSTSAFKKL
jgi:hypothetical protein